MPILKGYKSGMINIDTGISVVSNMLHAVKTRGITYEKFAESLRTAKTALFEEMMAYRTARTPTVGLNAMFDILTTRSALIKKLIEQNIPANPNKYPEPPPRPPFNPNAFWNFNILRVSDGMMSGPLFRD
jgi:hypothetical protein